MADTPISGLDAATPINLPKKGGPVDPNLLQNMQAMVDERSVPNPKDMIFSGPNYNAFMSGLKDAAAWASGGVNGPTAGLATRDREKSLEAKDLYEMRTKIATMQAAQERQKRAAEVLGLGAPAQPGIESQIGVQPVGGAPASTGAASAQPTRAAQAQPTGGAAPYQQMMSSLPPALQPLAKMALAEGDFEAFGNIVKENVKARPDMQKNYEYAQTLPADQKDVYLRTIQKDGYAPQTYIGEDGQEYKFTPKAAMPKEAGTTPGLTPPPAIAGGPRPAASTGEIQPGDIRYVESRNRPYAQGPEVLGQGTAKSSMQVMDATSLAPGYGVRPAQLTGDKVKDEAERTRVGEDYFTALKKNYNNNSSLAAAAYVWGPGKVDAWMKSGAKLEDLPTNVKTYVADAHLTGAVPRGTPIGVAAQKTTETQPETITAPPVRKSVEQIASEKAGETRRREKMAEGDVDTTKAIVDIGRNAGEKSIRLTDAARIVNDPGMKDMFGVLERGGVLGPITKFVAGGIQMGTLGSLKFGEMEGALRNAGATDAQIANVARIETVLKQQELEYAKTYLKGQGAVSDNERNIVKQAIGSIQQPAEQLRLMVNIMQERAAFDNKMYQAFNEYRKTTRDPYASFEKFTVDSPAADRIINEHNQALARTLKVDAGALNDPFNKEIATRTDKQTSGGVTYRKVQ